MNLTFVAFSRYYNDTTGQLFVFMVMAVAACKPRSDSELSSRSSETASRSTLTTRVF